MDRAGAGIAMLRQLRQGLEALSWLLPWIAEEVFGATRITWSPPSVASDQMPPVPGTRKLRLPSKAGEHNRADTHQD